MRLSELRKHAGLVILLAAFGGLGLLYLQTVPLLEMTDEPSHFFVVKYIADEARLPPERTAPPDAGPVPVILPGPPVYYAPPLYYLLGAPLIAGLDTDGFAEAVIPNPNWTRGWSPAPGRSPENKHIYVHTADERPPLAGWAAAMVRLRLFSLCLGGVTVVGVYVLARQTGPLASQPAWSLAATALVAFNPVFVFTTIGVTNDALLITLSTWAFVLMARLVGRGYSTRSLIVLGILSGLAVLTKQSALIFGPAAALAIVWGARGQARPWRAAFRGLLICALLVALVAGWWYLHNALTYGDPLGLRPHRLADGQSPSPSLILRELGQALQGYWGAFGWGLILVDPLVYVVIAAFVLFSLLGWLRRRPGSGSRAVALLGFGLLLNLSGLLVWLWRTSVPYGSRLLFPTLGPAAVLLVWGWRRWLAPRHAWPFAWAVASILGLYALIVPVRYLEPVYASPVVSPSAIAGAIPVDVRFDVPADGAALHLLAYRVTPERAAPGDRVTLTLYWQKTAPLDDHWTVFVHLAPQDPQQRVAGLDDYLGSSRYPSGVWRPGETIRQIHHLRLPGDVAAPALYWFSVGLYGERGDERLPVIADGNPVPGRAVRLGPLRVQSPDPGRPDQPVDYWFGPSGDSGDRPAIQLTGYEVETPPDSAGASRAITVTLYWQAHAAPQEDWVVFVHLRDGEGNLVAQHDGSPRQGDYPTWAWQAGDRVPDAHTLLLPPDLAPGTLHLFVGLYRPADGLRAPILDPAGRPLPDAILPLADIEPGREGLGDE